MKRYYWSRAQWSMHEAIFDRFVELAAHHSFIPTIVFLPGTGDIPIDKRRRAWLQEYSQEHNVPFLDLSAPIHNAGKQAFIRDNPHYNPYGHQIVAKELYYFLAEQVVNDR